VLISALDDIAADAILQQMSTDDAAKVRSALVELDDIPAEEQQRVLGDFLRQQGAMPRAATSDGDDVALELDPAVEAAAASIPELPEAAVPLAEEKETLFAFLDHVEPKTLATLLAGELPQTVAFVVAQLPPQNAAAVLQELPADLATDALGRIAWIDELSPDIRADMAHELRRQLAPHINALKAGTASLAHVTAVLGAMDYRQRQRVVLQLADRNTALLRRLNLFPTTEMPTVDGERVVALRYRLDADQPATQQARTRAAKERQATMDGPWLKFEELLHLDDAALRAVFAAADTEISLIALTGAEPRLIARILRKLPSREAALLRHRLEHPGPLRLRDVDQAQAALAAVATRLAHEGTIELPASARFAAAV
jgi:flagellar motor switch protein FliG